MRARKKPVIIECWRWTYSPTDDPAPVWASDALSRWPEVGGISFEPDHPDGPRMVVHSREGLVILTPGNLLMKGVQGELYVCDSKIFEETYEVIQ